MTQIHRDLQKAAGWYKPEEFVAEILQGLDKAQVQEMAEEIKALVAHPNLFGMDEATIDVCRRWDVFCHRFSHAYQDLAVKEMDSPLKG